MKTILLILALALVARAQISGYQALDIAEAQSSTEIQTLIQFGLQTIVQDAIQLGYFNNTNFALSKINSVYEKVSDSGDYLFDVVYADPSGVTISANFEVNYNVALNSISIVSYSYGVSYPAVDPSDDSDDTPVVENWSKIAVSTFNSNQELQALFQSGLARVIANGVNNASIPDTTFISAVISNIAQRSVDNGVVYRFSGKVTDQQGTTLTLTFDVLNQLYSSVYGVTVTPLPPVDNSTNSTNPEEGEGETEVGETGETGETGPEDGEDDGEGEIETPTENGEVETPTENGEVETPVENGEDDENNEEEATVPVDPVDPVEPGNNSTNTTEPNVDIVSGLPYTRLDVDEALESNLVNVLLKYGYESVTKLGINQKKLQNTTYSVLDVSKVGRYNFSNGVSYLFEVNLIGDNRHILVDTNYTVYYRYSNKTAKLTAYFYNYTIYRNEIPVTDNNTTVPDNNTTIPDTNTTLPDTNTTIPDTNTTIPDTNTTIPDTNTTIPDTNTTVPDNNTTAPVDLLTQIKEDALLQSVFSYGVNGVLTSGIAKGKLVDTEYDVTNVYDYKRTNLSSTANFRFEARLANANGSVIVCTNFTVNYRYSNQSLRLTGFSYNSTITKNVPNTPSGNNNTNTTVPSTNTTVPDATNTTTNGTTNSTSNTYVAVNASEIASSQEIQSVLSYGTQQIIQRGIQTGKVPSANYTISEVVSVSRLAQKGGNSYQCSVNLDGDNEAEVKTTFTAFYNSTSQAVSLQKYSYAVLNIPVA